MGVPCLDRLVRLRRRHAHLPDIGGCAPSAADPEGPLRGYLFDSSTAGAWPRLGRGGWWVVLCAAVRGTIARLSSGMRPAGHRWRGEAQEGSALLEVALPSSSISVGVNEEVVQGGACGDR